MRCYHSYSLRTMWSPFPCEWIGYHQAHVLVSTKAHRRVVTSERRKVRVPHRPVRALCPAVFRRRHGLTRVATPLAPVSAPGCRTRPSLYGLVRGSRDVLPSPFWGSWSQSPFGVTGSPCVFGVPASHHTRGGAKQTHRVLSTGNRWVTRAQAGWVAAQSPVHYRGAITAQNTSHASMLSSSHAQPPARQT